MFLACMNDVRYNTMWFPMAKDEEADNEMAIIVLDKDSLDGCSDGLVCTDLFCPPPSYCLNHWRLGLCV